LQNTIDIINGEINVKTKYIIDDERKLLDKEKEIRAAAESNKAINDSLRAV